MFIQNQFSFSTNHLDVILGEINNADELLFIVAYVKENGVDIILDKVLDKPTKLLCSLDMGITQLSGIKKLIDNGVEVRVYQSNKGTFHPKVWLFGKDKKNWRMLIGSANLTSAAFIDNVEASVLVEEENTTSNAVTFFYHLWNEKNSSTINIDEVNSLQKNINERKAFKNKFAKIIQEEGEKIEVLLEYVKSWIDIPKYNSKGISSLWRGWYVIPDQGHINDLYIRNLKDYLPFIGKGITVGEGSNDKNYSKLLDKFKSNSNFQRQNLKTSMHGLFTRQAKNYLLKFDWCYQPDRNTLCLTDLGEQINRCSNSNLTCIKKKYSEYFHNYSFNGLTIIKFTKQLLNILEYLTLDEFNYFVVHAYSDDDLDVIVDLIKVYRSLSSSDEFQQDFQEYFNNVKGGTAEGVYMNYVKSIKHTISVIAWCNDFFLSDDFILRLDNAS